MRRGLEIAILFLQAIVSASYGQIAASSPPLNQLRYLIGEPETSAELQSMLRSKTIRIYSMKEEVKMGSSGRLGYKTVNIYGGDGFLLVAEGNGVCNQESGVNKEREPAVIRTVKLILGICEEAEHFGIWKGDLPAGVRLPDSPEKLLANRVEASSDSEFIVNSGEVEVSRRRYIYFGGPMPENADYPFGFVFDKNELTQLVLLPPSRTRMIPPTKRK